MCGIVGYTGKLQAGPILIKGLERLEYRGYDSAGVAVRDGDAVSVYKKKGKLQELKDLTDDGKKVKGVCGVGHTRWATHGEATETNAHPHCSDDKNVVGVHNGIIENYKELKDKLTGKGYVFYSETDTEIAVKLIDYYYKKYKMGPIDALAKSMVRIRGSYALAVMFNDYPGEIYVARKDSPMILGLDKDGGAHVASDIAALVDYTSDVYYIDNLQMGRLRDGSITFYNLNGDTVAVPSEHIEFTADAVDKCGYEHFMIKEIFEQPKGIKDTLDYFVKNGKIDFEQIGLTDEYLKGITGVCILGCGSAYHVGVTLRYVIEQLSRVPVRVELASEFRYRNPILDERTLVVVISQSGETEDSKKALLQAKELGAKTLAIVNVPTSYIAREADFAAFTKAGPEIAVATTKAYSTQLIVGYLLAIKLAEVKGKTDSNKSDNLIKELYTLPDKVNTVLNERSDIQRLASRKAFINDVFFIGRGIDYSLCLECSLKLKEITYIHSEAYAAGELKHGTISLIEEGTVVFGMITQEDLRDKTISNLQEVNARQGTVIAVTSGAKVDFAEENLKIPQTDSLFAASVAVVVIQLFSYYISLARGIDPDKPRNLAKSVTVE